MPGTTENKKKRIAVLGGGPASLSTIFYILKTNNWDLSNYDITVYQMGWRLGGKCANGRNQQKYNRIEEHGIHFWFGCYHNAFALIKDCYEQLPATGYQPPFTWHEAFTPSKAYVGFEELDYGWDLWRIEPPAWPVPPEDVHIPLIKEDVYNKSLVDFVNDAIKTTSANFQRDKAVAALLMETGDKKLDVNGISEKIEEIEIKFTELIAQNKLGIEIPDKNIVLDFISLLDGLSKTFEDAFTDFLDHHIQIRKIFVAVNLGLTILKGMLIDNVFYDGFDVINEYDFIEWLRLHGASEVTLASTLVRSYYDGAFAYKYGDKELPDSEAGTTLKGLMFALFTTNQSMFWKMNGGMGEILFAPLYLVLKQYGVKFEFFHKVEHLTLSADKKSIGAIQIGRQVNLVDGLNEYDPLIDVKGVKSWVNEPKFECLKEGAELMRLQAEGHNVSLESFWTEWKDVEKITLQAGVDYDEVLLGISIGALPYLCGELIEANKDWQNMIANIFTVQTQSVQLWMNRTASEIGWPYDDTTIYTTYIEPLDTWSSGGEELIKLSTWPDYKPKDAFYYVGVMPDPGWIPPPTFSKHPQYMKSKVYDNFLEFLMRHMNVPFPRSQPTVGRCDWFNWTILYDVDRNIGHKRLDSQYMRANIDPSERYVLTVRGSSKYRLSPAASGFSNLIITGDWTKTFLNSGCFEAAIMSAMEAAYKITGKDPSDRFDNFFKTALK